MAVPAVITDLLVAIADNVPKGSDSVTTSTGVDAAQTPGAVDAVVW